MDKAMILIRYCLTQVLLYLLRIINQRLRHTANDDRPSTLKSLIENLDITAGQIVVALAILFKLSISGLDLTFIIGGVALLLLSFGKDEIITRSTRKKPPSAIAAQLNTVEQKIQTLRIQFKHAALLFDKFSSLKSKLQRLYVSTNVFQSDLRKWYEKHSSKLSDFSFESPIFSIELADEDVLSAYYDAQKDAIMKEWPVITRQVIENHEDEVDIEADPDISLTVTQIETFIEEQIRRFDTFDIQAYLLNREQYDWLPAVEHYLNNFAKNLDQLSTPFIHVKQQNVAPPMIHSHMLYGESPFNARFEEQVSQEFAAVLPQNIKTLSKHKDSYLKIETGIELETLVVAK